MSLVRAGLFEHYCNYSLLITPCPIGSINSLDPWQQVSPLGAAGPRFYHLGSREFGASALTIGWSLIYHGDVVGGGGEQTLWQGSPSGLYEECLLFNHLTREQVNCQQTPTTYIVEVGSARSEVWK